MYIRVIDDFGEFAAVRGDWDAVYAADPEAQFFLSWQWLSDWLTCHKTVWFVLAAKRDESDEAYAAFLPMRMRTQYDEKLGFFNQLHFAGDGFSDYTGILTRPEFEAEVVPAFAEFVKRKLHWARFTMDNLLMSEPRRRLFLDPFDKVRFAQTDIDYLDSRHGVDNSICLAIDLPADWDGYLATLSANNRQKIRRLLRKVEAAEDCRITLATPATFERDLRMLLHFWRIKWEPRKGERTESILGRNFVMLMRCARQGRLMLPVFWHGDRPVAALATLVDPVKKSLLFFITGRDETYSEMPAGYLLQAFSIREAIAGGFSTYDFLKGDEPYKYLFAPKSRRLRPLNVTTRSGRNLGGELDPRGLPAMIQAALDFERDGREVEAERCYRQIVELAPKDGLALYRFGRFLAKRGDHAGARIWLTGSVEAAPLGENAWLWLARSLQALGEANAAREACREVLKLQPDNEAATKLILELNAHRKPGIAALSAWPLTRPPREAMLDPNQVLQQLAAHRSSSSLGSKTKP